MANMLNKYDIPMPNLKWHPSFEVTNHGHSTPEIHYGRIKLSKILKFVSVLLNETPYVYVYTVAP